MVCQVEDCGASLVELKEYHQRYKVCERHLKMDYIVRDGEKLRFCQQCGRFHQLTEFDSNKRSCRERLQRHNARRRKRHRDVGGNAGLSAAAAAANAAAAAGLTPAEAAAMQEAVQFASATLMHTTAHGGLLAGQADVDNSPAAAAAAIAGLPFGGGLSAMPYVPSQEVLLLLLKGYAGMFHYSIDNISLIPMAAPTPLQDLSMPLEAAAAAAAAMAAAVPHAVADNGNAAVNLMAIQAQQEAHHQQQQHEHLYGNIGEVGAMAGGVDYGVGGARREQHHGDHGPGEPVAMSLRGTLPSHPATG